jgi:hypothetical protein
VIINPGGSSALSEICVILMIIHPCKVSIGYASILQSSLEEFMTIPHGEEFA